MQRYFIAPEQFGETKVTIEGEDARHIGTVMRGKAGDQFIVSDGVSKEAIVAIEVIRPQEVVADIIQMLEPTGEPWLEVTIAQSLPKGDKLETVIQKCTEIGAIGFIPFISQRTVVHYDGKKEEKRRVRWHKIAKEAAEQAHRSRIPVIETPYSWKELLTSFSEYELVCVCYEKEEGLQIRQIVQPFVATANSRQRSKVMVVVGPEGGFTEAEITDAETAGATSVGLGRRILRTETAAMAALTCIMYESGEMGRS